MDSGVGLTVLIIVMCIVIVVISVRAENRINDRMDQGRRRHQARPRDKGW